MSLLRKFIRQTVVARLKGRTIAQGRVSSNRGNKVWEEEVPALAVYSRREDLEKLNVAPIRYRREVRIAVEVFVEERQGFVIDEQVDDLCEQVEQVLLPAMMLPGTPDSLELDATDCRLESVEIDVDSEGKRLLGAARMTFLWVYFQDIDELDSEEGREAVGLFRHAFVRWDFPPPDGALEAADDIVLP